MWCSLVGTHWHFLLGLLFDPDSGGGMLPEDIDGLQVLDHRSYSS
jgi:hypothetical protein